jgi:hypothetical protein
MTGTAEHVRQLFLVLALLLSPLAISITAPGAHAAPAWAPSTTATVHPGVQTITDGAQCTANFVFFDAGNVYIGQAAHCSGTDGSTATNGCTAGSLPIGTPVEVMGASRPGVMVYNSWLTMQQAHESDPDTCQYNDLALVRLDPDDVGRVNPSVPFWGGPTGLNVSGTAPGEAVYSYGNSGLRLGLSPLSGASLGDGGSGWSHDVYTFTPGVPGDSGSAFLDSTGKAFGVLSTVQIAPLAGSNGVGDLMRELGYLRAHTSFTVQLALGTEPFDASRVS